MSRITDIISNVQVDLGDSRAERYSVDVLVRHLNAAIVDFVATTKCLRERIYVGLNYSSAIYDLRPYAISFIRAEYLNKAIPVKSFEELDAINPDWQSETGDAVQYIVFDNMPKGMFRVYPRVEGAASIVSQNSFFGGLVDITIGDDDYQIPTLADAEEDIEKFLAVYAIKRPVTVDIATADANLEIPAEFDIALEAYIKYKCLFSDTDAVNRQYAAEQLNVYGAYVQRAKSDMALNNNVIHDRVIKYNGGFNA